MARSTPATVALCAANLAAWNVAMKRCAPVEVERLAGGDGVGTSSEVAQHRGAGRHLRHRLAEGLT